MPGGTGDTHDKEITAPGRRGSDAGRLILPGNPAREFRSDPHVSAEALPRNPDVGGRIADHRKCPIPTMQLDHP